MSTMTKANSEEEVKIFLHLDPNNFPVLMCRANHYTILEILLRLTE